MNEQTDWRLAEWHYYRFYLPITNTLQTDEIINKYQYLSIDDLDRIKIL